MSRHPSPGASTRQPTATRQIATNWAPLSRNDRNLFPGKTISPIKFSACAWVCFFYFIFNSKCTKTLEKSYFSFQLLVYLLYFRDGIERFIFPPMRNQPRGRKLSEFPCFLRFDSVVLIYNFGRFLHPWRPSLFLKQRLFLKHLQVLKPALVDSNLFYFTARINQYFAAPAWLSPYFKERSLVDFEDHFALLEHLRNKLLPICDSSRHYEFQIEIIFAASGPNAATNVIESLLQMPQIVACSNVKIDVRDHRFVATHLPLEAIAKWLNQKPDTDNPTGVINQMNSKKQEKFLAIHLFAIQNELEVIANLTEVYFVYFIENSNFKNQS